MRVRTGIKLALFAVLVIAATMAVVFRREIAIAYHLNRKQWAWDKVVEKAMNPPIASDQDDYLRANDRHRDALVRLGYYERREFPLGQITMSTLQSRRMWEEVIATFPEHTDAHMQGSGAWTPDMIVVWDRPENLPKWEAIIKAHDQPPAGPPGEASFVNVPRPEAYVGTWVDEEDNVIVTITATADNGLRLKMPGNDVLQIVIKNVRVEHGLRFDIYHFTPPREELKSPSDQSGEHPFTGVRCRCSLAPDEDHPGRLVYTMVTIPPDEPTTTLLRRAEVPAD